LPGDAAAQNQSRPDSLLQGILQGGFEKSSLRSPTPATFDNAPARSSGPSWRSASSNGRWDGIFVASEPQFNLDDDTYVNPDILVHLAAILTPDVRGGDALLAVEIADSNLRYDLNTKAALYAAHGVREYWVINAATLITMVHRTPSSKDYGAVDEVAPGSTLTPLLVPAFTVALGALELQLD
jgi:hypothetical protein